MPDTTDRFKRRIPCPPVMAVTGRSRCGGALRSPWRTTVRAALNGPGGACCHPSSGERGAAAERAAVAGCAVAELRRGHRPGPVGGGWCRPDALAGLLGVDRHGDAAHQLA